MSFSGKNCLITGGTVGIGLEVIKQLLERGASNVAILDLINTNNIVDTLNSQYPKQNVHFFETDVSDKENVRKSFQAAVNKFQYIDVVIGNAGILNEHEPEKTIQINLLGMLHSTYAAIDFMGTNKSGRGGGIVLNVASVAGLDNLYSIPSYAASKHGVVGLTRCFGNDAYYQMHGINFITVCPGFTDTRIIHSLDLKLTSTEALDGVAAVQQKSTLQKPEMVGRCIADILLLNKNGSIWIIDDGKYKEITLTTYWLK